MSNSPVPLHLAQFNTATLRHPIDHPEIASFVALLDEVNARAESSPGFVWRHTIDSRQPDNSAYDDPLVLVNASVWESPTHLRDFAYKGLHKNVFRRRAEWFTASSAVMWWIPAGTIPTLVECMARRAFHERFGPTPYAFGNGPQPSTLVMLRHELDDTVVQSMIQRLNGELKAATLPGGSNFWQVDAEQVSEDNGAMLVAWLDGQPRACGAWRRIEVGDADVVGEIKRMWSDPGIRRARLGAAVLATLEATAKERGISELRLETGDYLAPAIGLYRRFGFEACKPWGEYVGVAHSYTMSKRL